MNDPDNGPLCEIGVVGLGVMGRSLLLNIAGRGFPAAGYDNDAAKLRALTEESGSLPVKCGAGLKEFSALLRRPRAVLLLVPAGAPVDAVIEALLPFLEKGDLVIDAGNSYYEDTDRRGEHLSAKGIKFAGVGISGGEEGARLGPSLMAGGDREAYERVRPVFEAIAAKAGKETCAAWLGQGSAGHFVKMTHNGIEYALMQLISETYDLMKRGLGLGDPELSAVYRAWNEGELNSYLVGITAEIFARADKDTGGKLIDEISDVALQKGTGMWTSRSAMELHVPAPTIDISVAMRDLSALKEQRSAAAGLRGASARSPGENGKKTVERLNRALYAAFMITYAQGLALLSAASKERGYALKLETVAGIWRGGCIIRSAMLDVIRAAVRRAPALANILLDQAVFDEVAARREDLAAIVCAAAGTGLPAPAFMSALAYFDAYRAGWLPANLIQAQRDYFGAHGYGMKNAEGVFHTDWHGTVSSSVPER
ncbi:MAG: NADP-dependent phosphogluconate dehydrogenase [Elusimicrobiales bacterium]|jgi:6-phosphogluconate dehydrogenase